jgi:hypothetical protein
MYIFGAAQLLQIYNIVSKFSIRNVFNFSAATKCNETGANAANISFC